MITLTHTHTRTQHSAELEVGRELTPDWGGEGTGVGKKVRVIESRKKVRRRAREPETEERWVSRQRKKV